MLSPQRPPRCLEETHKHAARGSRTIAPFACVLQQMIFRHIITFRSNISLRVCEDPKDKIIATIWWAEVNGLHYRIKHTFLGFYKNGTKTYQNKFDCDLEMNHRFFDMFFYQVNSCIMLEKISSTPEMLNSSEFLKNDK